MIGVRQQPDYPDPMMLRVQNVRADLTTSALCNIRVCYPRA